MGRLMDLYEQAVSMIQASRTATESLYNELLQAQEQVKETDALKETYDGLVKKVSAQSVILGDTNDKVAAAQELRKQLTELRNNPT